MTAEAETVVASVVRTVRVACSQERAFRVFTEVGSWWPLDQYSLGEERAETVRIEPRVGGLIVESIKGGETAEWGSVAAWEPFDRLVLEWRVRAEKPATEVEVTFTPDGDGTIVRLEHRYWERYGDEAAEARSSYDTGWQGLLGIYSEAAGKDDRKA